MGTNADPDADPDLRGRTALVTGSSSGIGRGFLLACADCGADVAVHYRSSAEEAEATAAEARDRGVEATTVQGDVTDPDDVDAVFDAVEAAVGSVDLLVNNVGAFAPRHWAEMDYSTWRTVMDTNLTATYLCSKRALPAMRDRQWGRIVNVGYAGSEKGLIEPKNAPYFIAKTGVLMFTRMLAADTQDDGVTVNAISPYVVETSDAFPDDAPRGRWATVDDLTAVLLFFVSDAASYVSGQNVEVDGGYLPESV
ncbi:SDR family NAD(P)-dependent oxidoreductase [Candidatus Halobonum tyrrellensis]|uniref:Short-chain dehydrogenase/reductase SDR n=1 Tax=Candidatus Halobonum tyrrellensis G22 TaxID=1324957 RepID=V4IX13_9EURY|nr:SDR family NAD(P)-dependent oxidoreductase [Candidatus Halobonum tyrrellensis]ESP87722.1 short-chain dehydrogenase/reductase SDR [Candidatus Halobonum tyrrellensis G22]